MKKLLLALAAICAAMTANAQFRSAEKFDLNLTLLGEKSIEDVRQKFEAKTPRTENGKAIEGAYIALTGGATAFGGAENFYTPRAGVSFGTEEFALGRGAGWNRFGAEVNLSALVRPYGADAYTPGKLYWAYASTAIGKIRLAEDRAHKHRFNLMLSGGYLYSRDNNLIAEVETPTTVDSYILSYTGSGLTFGTGLEYSYRFNTTRVFARARVENVPVVHLNNTERIWSGTAEIGLAFGIARRRTIGDVRDSEVRQLETGEITKLVEIAGPFLGINAGASTIFGSNGWSRMVGFSVGAENMGIGKDKYGQALRWFGAELNVAALMREYDARSISAGRQYWSYATTGYADIRLFENRWQNIRLDVTGLVGYVYSRDASKVLEVETPTSVDTYYGVYTGSGVTYGGGLKVSVRPPYWATRFVIRATAENQPIVSLNQTDRKWGIKLTLGISFGWGRIRVR